MGINLTKAKGAAQGAVPAKTKKASKTTDAKNVKNVAKAIKERKDGMYRYKGEMSLADKKKFRAEARRKLAKYEKLLKTEKGAELAKAQKNAGIFLKNTYTPGENMPKLKLG